MLAGHDNRGINGRPQGKRQRRNPNRGNGARSSDSASANKLTIRGTKGEKQHLSRGDRKREKRKLRYKRRRE